MQILSFCLRLLLRLALSLIALAYCLSGCAGLAVGTAEPPRWQVLAPNIWWLPGQVAYPDVRNAGDTSNHVFVQGQDRGWLIGSGASPAQGERIKASLQTQLGAVVTDVIAARAHPQSVLGAAAFGQARLWALPDVASAMAQRCDACLERLKRQTGDASLSAASVRLPDEKVVQGAWGPFQILAMQRSASDWTTLIHHRDSGYWFSPGLVWGAGVVPELVDAHSGEMLKALEDVLSRAPTHLVPEQGRPGGLSLVMANVAYWRALREECLTAQGAGVAELDFIAAPGPMFKGAFEATPFNVQRHHLNRQRIWRELEADAEAQAYGARSLSLR